MDVVTVHFGIALFIKFTKIFHALFIKFTNFYFVWPTPFISSPEKLSSLPLTFPLLLNHFRLESNQRYIPWAFSENLELRGIQTSIWKREFITHHESTEFLTLVMVLYKPKYIRDYCRYFSNTCGGTSTLLVPMKK